MGLGKAWQLGGTGIGAVVAGPARALLRPRRAPLPAPAHRSKHRPFARRYLDHRDRVAGNSAVCTRVRSRHRAEHRVARLRAVRAIEAVGPLWRFLVRTLYLCVSRPADAGHAFSGVGPVW